jgi:hypothetical protein
VLRLSDVETLGAQRSKKNGRIANGSLRHRDQSAPAADAGHIKCRFANMNAHLTMLRGHVVPPEPAMPPQPAPSIPPGMPPTGDPVAPPIAPAPPNPPPPMPG